jgi:long-chain acyl-CoA synthetase
MLSHSHFVEMGKAGLQMFAIGPDDELLSYLPYSHVLERIDGIFIETMAGSSFWLARSLDTLVEDIHAARPTIMLGVPRVFEKVYEATRTALDQQTGARRKLADWALGVGRRTSALRQQGKDLPLSLSLQHRLADRLVYSKVKQRLGGRVRLAVSGAAPLSIDVLEYFHALDVLILEGYGLSECTSGASVNRPHRYKFGTVGLPVPKLEARTAEDGELLLRGPTIFAGYYDNEEATRAVLGEDGWLRTGDVAEIDADGFIRITDRKKDILVTAGGKKVAPQNLENLLKGSKYVSQALVIGDRRPYIAALISLDEEAIGTWADEHGIPRDAAELSRNPEVVSLLQSAVDDANRGRSGFEQIKRFRILPRDFSAEEGEITPTLKLRRRVAEQNFTREIDELYEG